MWEEFFGDGKDPGPGLVRKSVIEDSGFTGSRCVALDHQWDWGFVQAPFRAFVGTDEADAPTALTEVGLQNERVGKRYRLLQGLERITALGLGWGSRSQTSAVNPGLV